MSERTRRVVLVQSRRLGLAIGATLAFAIIAVLDVVRWLRSHQSADLVLALGFVLLTVMWATICVRWSKQR